MLLKKDAKVQALKLNQLELEKQKVMLEKESEVTTAVKNEDLA